MTTVKHGGSETYKHQTVDWHKVFACSNSYFPRLSRKSIQIIRRTGSNVGLLFMDQNRTTMSDDKSKRNYQDSSKINTSETYEVRYWCNKFHCSKEELSSAVKEVGSSAEKVGSFLRGRH
jgi:hypothetical protein